jgi:hypothetical protein
MGFRDGERDAYLRAQVESGEAILAIGPPALVTDRRVLWAWWLHWAPHAGELTHDALTFDEITRWTEGRLHDERPVIRLEHPVHRRLEWVPARRFLLFRWGNAIGEVSRDETTISFGRRRDQVFRAMKGRLELTRAGRGEPFVQVLPGTREERRGAVSAYPFIPGRFGFLRGLRNRLLHLDERLHHARITWWIRLGSWLLLAVPALFVRPWLALPAIALVEAAWIASLQWSWHLDRHRRSR